MMVLGRISYRNTPKYIAVRIYSLSSNCVALVCPLFPISLPQSPLQLFSDYDEFHSCVRSIQSALVGVPNMSGLYDIPRTVASIFALFGKGRSLLEDEDYSVCDVTHEDRYPSTGLKPDTFALSLMKRDCGLPLNLVRRLLAQLHLRQRLRLLLL